MQKKSIYVTHQGARLQRADGFIAVTLDKTVVEKWHPDEIERVLVFGNVQVTTQLLALLLDNRIQVSFFSLAGRYRGQLIPPDAGNVFLRLAQHARHADAGFRLSLSRDLIRTKLRKGREAVRRFARNHPETAAVMDEAARRIDDGLGRLDACADEESLRGIEGAAAAAYFEAFDHMVRPPFRFERRSKHPAHNAVNALLNFGYTLLGGEIAGRLESVGFDPRIGYFHGVRYGRQSLALDLIEAHRVDVIDRLTLSILNRRMLSLDDFAERGEELGVRLQPAALKRYLALYEAALGDAAPGEDSPRTRIAEQVSALRRAVMQGTPTWEAEGNGSHAPLDAESPTAASALPH